MASAVGATFAMSGFAAHAQTVKSGTFRGSRGVSTSGSVSVVKSGSKLQIVLSGNFSTENGPSLWVYLGNGSPSVKVSRLKSARGSQTYTVPASVDASKYSTVYIYCRPFKKTFGQAKLR